MTDLRREWSGWERIESEMDAVVYGSTEASGTKPAKTKLLSPKEVFASKPSARRAAAMTSEIAQALASYGDAIRAKRAAASSLCDLALAAYERAARHARPRRRFMSKHGARKNCARCSAMNEADALAAVDAATYDHDAVTRSRTAAV